MTRRSSREPRIGRKNALSIVYFIDHGKTQSVKLPVGIFYASLLGLVVLMTWGAISIFLLKKLSGEREKLGGEVSQVLGTLFTYQGKYDGIYSQKRDAPAKGEVDSRLAGKTITGDEAGKNVTPPQAVSPASPLKDDTALKTDGSSDSADVGVQNAKLSYSSDHAIVRFDLQNRQKSGKAEGFVWGVAKFGAKGEPILEVSAPIGFKLNANGGAEDVATGERFSIKKFKSIELNFGQVKPEDQANLLGVTLGIYNSETKTTKIISLPLGQGI